MIHIRLLRSRLYSTHAARSTLRLPPYDDHIHSYVYMPISGRAYVPCKILWRIISFFQVYLSNNVSGAIRKLLQQVTELWQLVHSVLHHIPPCHDSLMADRAPRPRKLLTYVKSMPQVSECARMGPKFANHLCASFPPHSAR